MSYARLVSKQLDTAFKLAKDLVQDVIFTPAATTGFNFNISTPITTVSPPVTVKALVMEPVKKTPTEKKNLLIKTPTDFEVTAFSDVNIAGLVWKVGPVIQAGEHTVLLEVYKEG